MEEEFMDEYKHRYAESNRTQHVRGEEEDAEDEADRQEDRERNARDGD